MLYRAAIARVGQVWSGAKLVAVEKRKLPLRPRARGWLPSEPSVPEEIAEIFKYCNPNLPAHDWKVIKLEKIEEPYRQALVLLNAESLGPLADTKGVINYGFEKVVLRVYQADSKGDGPLPTAMSEEKKQGEQKGG